MCVWVFFCFFFLVHPELIYAKIRKNTQCMNIYKILKNVKHPTNRRNPNPHTTPRPTHAHARLHTHIHTFIHSLCNLICGHRNTILGIPVVWWSGGGKTDPPANCLVTARRVQAWQEESSREVNHWGSRCLLSRQRTKGFWLQNTTERRHEMSQSAPFAAPPSSSPGEWLVQP